MSKNNVNPDHYKLAGRERQGEDIPQTRNKQTQAESEVRRRAERDANTPSLVVARPAKTAARKAQPAPLQSPPGHKRGHTLVPGSAAPHARFEKTKPAAILRPTGTVPALTPKRTANKRRKGSTAQK